MSFSWIETPSLSPIPQKDKLGRVLQSRVSQEQGCSLHEMDFYLESSYKEKEGSSHPQFTHLQNGARIPDLKIAIQ